MTGPVVRLVFSLRSQLKAARKANQRLLFHVARQEAVIANLQADLEAKERMVRALMETAPTDVRDLA